MKFEIKTDLSPVRSEKRKQISAMLSSSGKACRDGIGVYFRWLAQYAPPNIGSAKINQNLYERPAVLLPIAIARGSRTIAADRAALAEGYSWKVSRRKKTPLYFKGKGENPTPQAKKARHIVNRGLLKWAFVGVLPEIGVAVPVALRPLAAAKRGKNLKKIESLVASATLTAASNELLFKVTQKVQSSGTSGWYGTAARIAEEQHDHYLELMMSKFGKVQKR
jgi:hypothetical protein